MQSMLNRLRSNPLVDTLIGLRGNPRSCVYTEPMWGIPYNLYAPFATLFMYALGVNDKQIGIILSIGMFFQVIAALFGGVLCDKLGRRLTTVIFDTLAWSVPCLIWTFSQNFWWFLIASIFNSAWQITNVSWNCMLVEDCDKRKLVNIFTWVHISGLLAVFFAPISAFLVGKFSMIPVVRSLYFFSFVSMTAKFIVLYLFSTETKPGMIRMQETRSTPIWAIFIEYRQVIGKILTSSTTIFILIFVTLFNISTLAINNFFSLYVTQNLMIADQFIAVFPMVRAAIMLIFMFTLQNWFNRLPFRPVMISGFLIYIISHVLLTTTPVHNLVMLFGYVLAEALAFSMIAPRKDSMLVWFVDEHERARINSIIYVFMIGCTAPFGYLVGFLSSVHRVLPFVFNIIIYIILIIMIFTSKAFHQNHNVQGSNKENANELS